MASYTFQVVATGSSLMLENFVNKTAIDERKLKLYVNDATITTATVVGDLTECTTSGYAAYALPGASWTVSWSTDKSIANFTVDNTITFAAGVTVYGAYITNAAGTILIGAADFGAGKTFASGDELKFTDGNLTSEPVQETL